MSKTEDVEARRARYRARSAKWRAANPEKDRAKSRAWARANPEKRRAKDKRYQEANRDRINARNRERKASKPKQPKAENHDDHVRTARKAASAHRRRKLQKEWRAANRDRNLGLIRAWKARNPEKRRADRKARKIEKRQTTIVALSKLQRGRCAVCRDRLGDDLHIDHIMPRKLGGSNDRSNLQLTCPTCNLVKSAQHPIDHARSMGRLI